MLINVSLCALTLNNSQVALVLWPARWRGRIRPPPLWCSTSRRSLRRLRNTSHRTTTLLCFKLVSLIRSIARIHAVTGGSMQTDSVWLYLQVISSPERFLLPTSTSWPESFMTGLRRSVWRCWKRSATSANQVTAHKQACVCIHERGVCAAMRAGPPCHKDLFHSPHAANETCIFTGAATRVAAVHIYLWNLELCNAAGSLRFQCGNLTRPRC